ncbi:chloride channel protein [Diaminobutyricibacter tongyongensis]|uniref:Chloride channel protein n=1 Tax=Leifsonia tongyongensis TaxID=1268043 RepID=A0A6L9XTW4_9MICO|nr:chloride channel protein [Diaminobutyricibacter tongyongensis]NEN04697.1 chloride channel protein [Diaminobutyricibacter tongyongensis]
MSSIRAGTSALVSGWSIALRRAGDKAGVGSVQLVGAAIIIGAGAGFAAVGFRWLVSMATLVFTGTTDYSGTTGHPANPWVPWLGGAFVILAPAVGGLIYGPLVDRFAREARGHGVPEVMYAVAKKGGRIAGKVAIVKAVASAITIGSGGSVGREGPIVQIGSALGSTLGRLARMPDGMIRTLVACGAAGGIAATFNAPIAGVFFALELLLRDFAARSFAAVMLSSITASIVGRAILGDHPFLALPPFSVANPSEFALFAVLGLVAGLVGIGFTKILYLFEDISDRLWRGPEWLRPVVGGLLLGLVLFALPQMYGVGYPVLEKSVLGGYTLAFLLLLVVGKIVATSLTIAIGGSGGVFAPSLFIGAALGAAFGEVVGVVFPALAGQAGAFALVGMGAVFAGATRAPITAGIILFELTGEYTIILPLLLAIVVATGVSRLISRDTIYTLKLRRRGVNITSTQPNPHLHAIHVRDVMSEVPEPLISSMSVEATARALAAASARSFPVVDGGTYRGIVTSRQVADVLENDDSAAQLTVREILEECATTSPEATLDSALDDVLDTGDSDGIPVLGSAGELRGWLGTAAVLRALAGER